MKDSDWSILTGPAVRQDPLVILGQDLVTCVQQSLVITLSLNIYKTSGVIKILPSSLTACLTVVLLVGIGSPGSDLTMLGSTVTVSTWLGSTLTSTIPWTSISCVSPASSVFITGVPSTWPPGVSSSVSITVTGNSLETHSVRAG